MAKANKAPDLTVAELEEMLTDRRKGISKLQKKRQKLLELVSVIDAEIHSLGGAATAGGRVRNEQSLGGAIASVLAKAGTGVPVGDILTRVLATGYRTTSDNFRSIVNQALIKDKRFTAVERGIYTLKK